MAVNINSAFNVGDNKKENIDTIDAFKLFKYNILYNALLEDAGIYQLKTFSVKSEKELRTVNLLKATSPAFSIIFYYVLEKMKNFNIYMESEENNFNLLVYDLSFLYLLHSAYLQYDIGDDLYNEYAHLFSLAEQYAGIVNAVNSRFSRGLFNTLEEATSFIQHNIAKLKICSQIENLTKKAKKYLKYNSEEFSDLDEMLEAIISENFENLTFSNKMPDIEEAKVYTISLYPQYIFSDNYLIRENLLITAFLDFIDSDALEAYNVFLRFFHYTKFPELRKTSILGKIFHDLYISSNTTFANKLFLSDETFYRNFIEHFNLEQLKNDYTQKKITDALSFEKDYENIEQLKERLNIAVYKISSLISFDENSKFLSPVANFSKDFVLEFAELIKKHLKDV